MAEQMEQINVEEIMQDIRTQIAERGYTKNELKFADVAAKTGEMSDEIADYFELDHFGLTVERMNSTRKVQCWRDRKRKRQNSSNQIIAKADIC